MESVTHLRVCFASRPYPVIRLKKGLSMILDKEDGHGDDLTKFIQHKLEAGDGDYDERIRT